MMTFHQYLVEGVRCGWTPKEAVARLLRGAQQPSSHSRILGICRISHEILPTMEESRAALAAHKRSGGSSIYTDPPSRWIVVRDDAAPTMLPRDLWAYFNTVEDDLNSHWEDDDEEPTEWRSIDWRAGTLRGWVSCSWLADQDDWWWNDNPRAGSATLSVAELQVAEALATELLKWTDEEMIALILAWPGTDSTKHWDSIKADPRRPKQTLYRELWRTHRNDRRGPPSKTPKAIL